MNNTVIIYHGDCPDGFGGAYAAWKKFGSAAIYLPLKHGMVPPPNLAGASIYIIDFSFPTERFSAIESVAEKLVVLDHHISAKEAVESVREHVFDTEHSGATLAWGYFHKTLPPKLLSYVEDIDLWKHALPHSREIAAYLSTIPFVFEIWDSLSEEFEHTTSFSRILEKGKDYLEYVTHALDIMAKDAELVAFEGYTVLAANAPRLFHSELGNVLARKNPPFAITYYKDALCWRVSLRGDGSVNCAAIAKRYGGGGHHDAAGFQVVDPSTLPFKQL